jgi:hypothetical protein
MTKRMSINIKCNNIIIIINAAKKEVRKKINKGS